MRSRSLSMLAVALAALTLAGAGCGSSSSSGANGTPTIHFATTKFVFHAGLAFGAFHRYLYKPLRAGEFAKPLSHKAAVAKAALATVFIVHELRIAYTDARASSTLRKLVSPLTALKDKVAALVAGLRAGHYNAAQIKSAQGAVSSIVSQSGSAGASIKDLPVPAF